VAGKAHLSGGTEDAAHRAACLGADARRAPSVGIAHQDALDQLAVRQAKEPLHRLAVDRVQLTHHFEGIQPGFARQPHAQSGGQVAHGLDTADLLHVQPLPDLARPVSRLAPPGDQRRQLIQGQIVKLDHGVFFRR